jgi:hypothetical protein
MKIEIKTTKLVGFGLEYFTITSPKVKFNKKNPITKTHKRMMQKIQRWNI